MNQAAPNLPTGMNRHDYYAWAEAQPCGRFELLDGKVVAMAPERAGHADAKALAWLLLRQAIADAGAACVAYPDGMTVEIGDDIAYEPDALVNCGPRIDSNAMAAPNPVIVVEVVSPSSKSIDSGRKLADYFRVPSIVHYLIVVTDRKLVIHHHRAADGTLAASILGSGRLTLDPPGISFEVEALFGA